MGLKQEFWFSQIIKYNDKIKIFSDAKPQKLYLPSLFSQETTRG